LARPFCCRRVRHLPDVYYFKPQGIALRSLEEVTLSLDELEALRLADLEGFYQEGAAMSMRVSRPTFSRIIAQARSKVADALVNGKAICLQGGPIDIRGEKKMITNEETEDRSRQARGLGSRPCNGRRRRQKRHQNRKTRGRCVTARPHAEDQSQAIEPVTEAGNTEKS
jgi:predicted DNA-binding protein (UPF0251 family)